MLASIPTLTLNNAPAHDWLKTIHLAFVPGYSTPVLEEAIAGLLGQFQSLGHVLDETPGDETNVILSTAPFGTPLRWRQAMIFTARSRFKLSHTPTFIAMMHCTPAQFKEMVGRLDAAIRKPQPDPADPDWCAKPVAGPCGNRFAVIGDQRRCDAHREREQSPQDQQTEQQDRHGSGPLRRPGTGGHRS